MPPELESIIANLAKAQTGLLSAADAVPPEDWKTKPGKDRWSAAELIAHLMTVERAVIGKADRVAQHPSEARFRIKTNSHSNGTRGIAVDPA